MRLHSWKTVGHAGSAQEAFEEGPLHLGTEFEFSLDHTPNVGMMASGHRALFSGHAVNGAGGLAEAAPVASGNLIINGEELRDRFHTYLYPLRKVRLHHQVLH
jgi:hypothetical protein